MALHGGRQRRVSQIEQRLRLRDMEWLHMVQAWAGRIVHRVCVTSRMCFIFAEYDVLMSTAVSCHLARVSTDACHSVVNTVGRELRRGATRIERGRRMEGCCDVSQNWEIILDSNAEVEARASRPAVADQLRSQAAVVLRAACLCGHQSQFQRKADMMSAVCALTGSSISRDVRDPDSR